MFIFIKHGFKFDRQHILLTNANHLAGGFGLAIVLQNYLVGDPFLPVAIGWVLVAFSAMVHLIAVTR